MVVHGRYTDHHSNYVIHGYSDKGVTWTMVVHGGYMDHHSNYVIHGYFDKGDTLDYGSPWWIHGQPQ